MKLLNRINNSNLLSFIIISLISQIGFTSDQSDGINFSLNLMWVNKSDVKTTLLCKREEQLDYIVRQIQEWQTKNNGVPINLWYDGELISEDAIVNTTDKLPLSLREEIIFRDFRNLTSVDMHPYAFSTKVSFYSRVDVLRFAIANDTLKAKDSPRYFIYTDIAITATNLSSLIKSSLNSLEKDGIVLANAKTITHNITGHALEFENSFMIIDKNKSDLLNAIEQILLASFFHFTSQEENLAFLAPEAVYQTLESFLSAHCNRHISIEIAAWDASFHRLDFEQERWGIPLDIWTRNFFHAPGCAYSLPQEFKSWPNGIPTIEEDIVRPSQFTKEVTSILKTPEQFANYILALQKRDAIAFVQRFSFEEFQIIIDQSGLSEENKNRLVDIYQTDPWNAM